MKRKWKLTNPPKKSGIYKVCIKGGKYSILLIYSHKTNKWFTSLRALELGWCANFHMQNENRFRWQHQ